MVSPGHCHRRLLSFTLLFLLGLIFPTPMTSFLPTPLHNRHIHKTLSRSIPQNLQDERSEASASPSFWQSLFPSAPRPSEKYEEELEALAAQVKYLKQHQSELAEFRQKLEDQQQEQGQLQSKKRKGQGLPYAGTWTAELTGGNNVHCTPSFNLGGFSFRLMLTEKMTRNPDDNFRGKHVPMVAGREGAGGRCIGIFVEYLPSYSTGEGGGGAAAVPCVQCRFELLNDMKEESQFGKEGGEAAVYESEPTFLDAAGGALGLPHFTHISDHPPFPLPLPLSRFQQLEGQQQKKPKLLVGFEVSLCAVHFLGATEQAQARREAWVRTEAAVEDQVEAALMKEEENRVAAEVRMREAGEWKEKVDLRFFNRGGGRGSGGRMSRKEEESFVEGSCDDENGDGDEKKKEKEGSKDGKEKFEEKEGVRTGARDDGKRRHRQNTGGREAEGEEEEVEHTDKDEEEEEGDDKDGNKECYEEIDGYTDDDDEEEEGDENVKGA